MVVGKVVAQLCLTLIIKGVKFSVEHDRVVTTLNTINQILNIIFSVAQFGVSDPNLIFDMARNKKPRLHIGTNISNAPPSVGRCCEDVYARVGKYDN
jgi:hypothetical protein